jgi:hypothetical protein
MTKSPHQIHLEYLGHAPNVAENACYMIAGLPRRQKSDEMATTALAD